MKTTSIKTVTRREVLKTSTGLAAGGAIITDTTTATSGDDIVEFSEVSFHYDVELPTDGPTTFPVLANHDSKSHVVDSANHRLTLYRPFGQDAIAAARSQEAIVSFNGYRGFPVIQAPQTLTSAPISVLPTDLRTTGLIPLAVPLLTPPIRLRYLDGSLSIREPITERIDTGDEKQFKLPAVTLRISGIVPTGNVISETANGILVPEEQRAPEVAEVTADITATPVLSIHNHGRLDVETVDVS